MADLSPILAASPSSPGASHMFGTTPIRSRRTRTSQGSAQPQQHMLHYDSMIMIPPTTTATTTTAASARVSTPPQHSSPNTPALGFIEANMYSNSTFKVLNFS